VYQRAGTILLSRCISRQRHRDTALCLEQHQLRALASELGLGHWLASAVLISPLPVVDKTNQ
jgi:hypothetical protein